jgi:Putative transposase/Phage integrase, N-terminal SAM-like domain
LQCRLWVNRYRSFAAEPDAKSELARLRPIFAVQPNIAMWQLWTLGETLQSPPGSDQRYLSRYTHRVAISTQQDYVQRVKNFAAFLGRSPETASFEDVRRYQLHLATSGAGVPTLNQSVSTLRFFFRASAETMTTIAADPKHLGARIGITSVLHSWGSAMTHHPHVHMIVPGGGISLDGDRWVSCRPGFFLPVRVLSRLFRRLFLDKLASAHATSRLKFFGDHAALASPQAFTAYLAPLLRKAEWVVYAKKPFGGPQAVLADLSSPSPIAG